MKYDFVETLLNHYSVRKAANQAYSMNAFARDLTLLPSQLSEVVRRKKGLSSQSAIKVAAKLKLSKKEQIIFVESVISHCGRSPRERQLAKVRLQKEQNQGLELSKAEFNIIKDWLNFALLEYLKINKTAFKVASAAEYFSVSKQRVLTSLSNLESVGLITKKGTHYLHQENTVFAPLNIPFTAKKLHHLKLLQISKGAYLNQDFDQRDYMSQIISVDSNKIKLAKKLIKDFHHNMNELLSPDSNKKRSVYVMSTQLFSLMKGGQYE